MSQDGKFRILTSKEAEEAQDDRDNPFEAINCELLAELENAGGMLLVPIDHRPTMRLGDGAVIICIPNTLPALHFVRWGLQASAMIDHLDGVDLPKTANLDGFVRAPLLFRAANYGGIASEQQPGTSLTDANSNLITDLMNTQGMLLDPGGENLDPTFRGKKAILCLPNMLPPAELFSWGVRAWHIDFPGDRGVDDIDLHSMTDTDDYVRVPLKLL